jgi:formylglycine-generating enzyme required for sulfatase activity
MKQRACLFIFILLFALAACMPKAQPSTTAGDLARTLTSTAIPPSSVPTLDLTGTSTFTPVAPGTLLCSEGAPLTSTSPSSTLPDFLDAKNVPMRFVPAGDFIMGSEYNYLEKPVHQVYLNDYYIDKYEVTNGYYQVCVSTGVCEQPKYISSFQRGFYFGNTGYKDYPVIFVDWNMAKTYCEWRGARLPTEAEWEKAARGTDERSYPWGTCTIDKTYSDQIYEFGDIYDTKRVGSYEKGKSVYGVYDMLGNASEWVDDWFSDTYYKDSPLSNPQGSDTGIWHVVRDYSSNRDELRVTSRIGYLPTDYANYVGFRCASDGTSELKPSLTQVEFAPTPTKTPDPSDYIDEKSVPMRFVPAGNFLMGSDKGQEDEKPIHTVYLNAYYMDKYEVTNARYKVCVDSGLCQLPRVKSTITRLSYYENPLFDEFPVQVDWNMARTYCEWRGARLPTEAEWEKAARGADGRTYPWGDGIDCSKANFYFVNHNLYCVGDTSQVGSFEDGKSMYGVYDLAGNIPEWAADWYSETYYQTSPGANPLGPASGEHRVLRGGSYGDFDFFIRSSYRGWSPQDAAFNGFRCAKPVP